MVKFTGESYKPPQEPDSIVEKIRKKRKEAREQAEDLAEFLRKKASIIEAVLSDESITVHIEDEGQRKEVEKIKRTWKVEITGKITAFARSDNRKYLGELTQSFLRVKNILLPAVEKKLKEDIKDYGFSEEEIGSSDELMDFTKAIPSDLLEGLLTLEDIEGILLRIIDNLTKPK